MSDNGYMPQAGDRVALPSGLVNTPVGDVTYVYIDGDEVEVPTRLLTLIERPAPPLPTEAGAVGTATVRGVPGVRVMRADAGSDHPWIGAREVGGWSWHADADLADFVPLGSES